MALIVGAVAALGCTWAGWWASAPPSHRAGPVGELSSLLQVPGSLELISTLQHCDGLEDERIVVSSSAGELAYSAVQLPPQGVEPRHEPWNHSWTINNWWRRTQWEGAGLTVLWPARCIRLHVPVDIATITAAAAKRHV
jgi:hypothetical protein